MKNFSKTICISLLSVLLLTGCGSKKDVVIKINDNVLTRQQYEAQLKELYQTSQNKHFVEEAKKDPDGLFGTLFKADVVEQFMFETLFNKECEKRNIKVSEKELDDAIKNIIDKIGSKEKFNQILKQGGISVEQFRRDMGYEIKQKKLVDSLAITKITDDDARKYYNEHPTEFEHPDQVRASHILIGVDRDKVKESIMSKDESKNLTPKDIEEQVDKEVAKEVNKSHEKAMKILAEVKKDPSKFAEIAKENSDDTGSARNGGDLGYFTKEQMVEPFSKVAFSLKPGVVSDIVETQFGYHIILVKDRVAAGKEPFEKVKEDIKKFMYNEERVNVFQNFITKVINEAKIEYVDPSFNPEEIQKKIKELAKNNPKAANLFMSFPDAKKQ